MEKRSLSVLGVATAGMIALFSAASFGDWTNQNSPTGVTGISALLATDDYLFAATTTPSYQVERSSDNGATWTLVNTSLTKTLMMSLAAKGDLLFVGTANGIYSSSNDGGSWTSASSGLSGPPINAITAQGRYLFAGSSTAGIFRSADNGSSWKTANSGFSTSNIVSSFTVNGGAIFAGTDHGVYRSTDSGANWTAVNSGLSNQTVQALMATGGLVYAGTGGGGVFRSTDNGANWVQVNSGLGINSIFAFAVVGKTLFASGSGVWTSIDSGNTWVAQNSGLTSLASLDLQALAVSGSYLVAADYYTGRIWRRPLADFVPVVASKRPQSVESFSLGKAIRNSASGCSIHFSTPRSGFISLGVYDLSGREIARLVNHSLTRGHYDASFSGASPAPGAYICILRADGRVVARSIAVRR